jgi:hypothetical protein
VVVTMAVFQWLYLLGYSRHYSPLLKILAMVVRRLSPEDLVRSHEPACWFVSGFSFFWIFSGRYIS